MSTPSSTPAAASNARYPLRSRSRSGKKKQPSGELAESEMRAAESQPLVQITPSSSGSRKSESVLHVTLPAERSKSPTHSAAPSPESLKSKSPMAARRLSAASTSLKGPTKQLALFALWLQRVWLAYLGYLESHPVLTKSLTAAVVSVVSDLLAQWLSGTLSSTGEGKSLLHTIDWISVRNQFIIGLVMRGMPLHYWYLFLTWLFRKWDGSRDLVGQGRHKHLHSDQELLPLPVDSTGVTQTAQCPVWVVVAKVLVDQLTYGPFTNWLYFWVIGWFENRDYAFISAKIAREFVPLMVANYKLWPAVSFINFKFVPPALQVLFGNIIAIFWTVYVIMSTR